MPKANLSEIKSRDRQIILVMARGFDKEGYTQHAIAAYEAVIEAAPESKEAEHAEGALTRIAEIYSQDYLYDRILERRTKKTQQDLI